MECSGKCCRHSESHSDKCETTAGSVEQRDYIHRQNQREYNKHMRPNVHRERGPQRKETNGATESFLYTNKSAKFVFPRPSSTTDFSTSKTGTMIF